jgi:hypothetical protein
VQILSCDGSLIASGTVQDAIDQRAPVIVLVGLRRCCHD